MSEQLQTLTVGYITQNSSDWLLLSLESIEDIADEIIIIDGGSSQEELEKIDKFIDGNEKYKIVHNKYPGTNGLQYQKVIDNATKDWIFIIDSDEVLGDNSHLLKEYLEGEKSIYNIRMNHCINDLYHIDATRAGNGYDPKYDHYVANRLFRNRDGIYFGNREHSTIIGFTEEETGKIDDIILWHYGKSKAMFELKEKFEMNIKRSKMHGKDFLQAWYMSLLTGSYPVKKLGDMNEHPSVIRRVFYLK